MHCYTKMTKLVAMKAGSYLYILSDKTHSDYIRWQLRTGCATMKEYRSFRRKNQICDFSLSN